MALFNLKLKLKRSGTQKCTRTRYDVGKLLNPQFKETFQKEIGMILSKVEI